MTWRRELRALYAPSSVLCLLLMALWLRSYWCYDAVGLRVGQAYAGVTLLNGQIRFDWEYGSLAKPTRWEREPVRLNGNLFYRQLAPHGPLGFASGTDYRRPPPRQPPAGPLPLWLIPPGTPVPPPTPAPPPPPPATVFRWVVMPLWLPAAVALLATPIWLAVRHPTRLGRRPRPGTCPACGYDLRAGHDRCPECGRPVDVAALMKAVLRAR